MSGRNGTEGASSTRAEARFVALYDSHYVEMRDFCCRRVAAHLVDDAVAETFLVAWRRIDDVPPDGAARLWLYRVAYRTIGHEWRGQARRRRLDGRLRGLAFSSSSGPEADLDDLEDRSRAREAAARLNSTDAEVLRLMAWEQLSIAGIAEVLGLKPNAVKQRLHRARRNLTDEYRRLEAGNRPIKPTADSPGGGSR